MNNHRVKIFNGRLVLPEKIVSNGSVLIRDAHILYAGDEHHDFPDAIEIDAKGNYISPGFIDIHVHGGGNYDFMDGSEEAFLEIAKLHAQFGTTSMLPTTLTSEKDDLLKTLDAYETAHAKNRDGARFIGMHLEGPYFALNQRGAQDPKYIRDPDPAEYEEILEKSSSIRRWSAAPELKGAIEFGKYVRSKGVLPAIAHTDAIYEEALAAFENGYTLATHLYSAMSGVTRKNAFRYAGVIETAFLLDEMDVEIIADGVHLPAPLLKLVYKIKGPSHIALITDAMRAAGMPEGESILGNRTTGMKVIVEDGVAKLPDRSSFAGSVATADRLVRTMVQMADVDLLNAIRMITQTPARIFGMQAQIGSIKQGLQADVVIFDDEITVSKTIIGGKIVFER